MGKTYEQVKDLKRPYKIVNANGRAAVQIDDGTYSPRRNISNDTLENEENRL